MPSQSAAKRMYSSLYTIYLEECLRFECKYESEYLEVEDDSLATSNFVVTVSNFEDWGSYTAHINTELCNYYMKTKHFMTLKSQ